MKNSYKSTSNFKLPSKNELESVFYSFTKKEWILFLILALVLIVSTLGILQKINKSFMVEVPAQGGFIKEGIIGIPRFVNPILASTDADKDLTALIYSGLMRKTPDGNIIPDLAEKVEISTNGLIYTFSLRDDIFFHDGEPVTVDDIIFTINSIRDPLIKSPRKANWEGVTIEKIDEKNLKFTLRQPYASFLENATLGIMPKHLWQNSPVELNERNMNPIGSGPYKVKSVQKESSGVISSYSLKYFKEFSLGKPHIKELTLKFYANEDDLITAIKSGDVTQASSLSPLNAEMLKDKHVVSSTVLPRVFGLFFNQNENQLFTNKNIVTAINESINKERIINEVLKGYGVVIDNPIPPGIINHQTLSPLKEKTIEEKVADAKARLDKDGWKIGDSGYLEKTTTVNKKKTTTILSFSISTGNDPELVKTAELIKEDLNAIGMNVEVKTFDIGNLNQSVIRPREYETLLFGQIIKYESDLYAFWHSSQRKDPGFNVAMYANAKVDKILEDAFTTIDKETRTKKYIQFEEEIKKDMPAIFLYSPSFIYIIDKDLKGNNLNNIISPSDRFLNSYSWYTKNDNIWKIFSK